MKYSELVNKKGSEKEYIQTAKLLNIALAAAFLAAEADSPVTMSHVLQGIKREYQKMGKGWDDASVPITFWQNAPATSDE